MLPFLSSVYFFCVSPPPSPYGVMSVSRIIIRRRSVNVQAGPTCMACTLRCFPRSDVVRQTQREMKAVVYHSLILKVVTYWIYLGKVCRQRIQTLIWNSLSPLSVSFYVKMLAEYGNGGVSQFCRGRQVTICYFLQITPFRKLASLFGTLEQDTWVELSGLSRLFGSDCCLLNARLWQTWRIECPEVYTK